MNVLFLTLLYPKESMEQVAALSKDGLQNQINNYQQALVKGLKSEMIAPEQLSIVNALPVGVFPTHYRKPVLSGGLRNGGIKELGSLNLPWFKQKSRERQAANAIINWAKQSDQNRTLLIYTLYLPYLKAAAKAKRKIRDLKTVAIVTDLPNEWGLASGRKGIQKRFEHAMGMNQLMQSKLLDGYVLVAEPMAEVLPPKPYMVMEGLILDDLPLPDAKASERPTALYTGTLNRELGIATLIKAFEAMPEYDLWLCGRGDMAAEAEASAKRCENIRYFGYVPQEEALRLQAAATVLVNPRSPEGRYTRYSFPSKTLEYMRSGKPVLCYHLDGIPCDYDAYLNYIQEDSPEGICRGMRALMAMDVASRQKQALAGRAYVAACKNPSAQCARILDFLRALT